MQKLCDSVLNEFIGKACSNWPAIGYHDAVVIIVIFVDIRLLMC